MNRKDATREQGDRWFVLYWSTRPQGEQSEVENVAMALIDNRKAYGPAKLKSRLSENVQDVWPSHKIHYRSHEKLESIMAAGGKVLAEVTIQRGIFLRDVLSPFLFVIAMIPLNHIFRKNTGG